MLHPKETYFCYKLWVDDRKQIFLGLTWIKSRLELVYLGLLLLGGLFSRILLKIGSRKEIGSVSLKKFFGKATGSKLSFQFRQPFGAI